MMTNIACVIILMLNGLFALGLGAYVQVATEMAVEAKYHAGLSIAALGEVGIYEAHTW
jgi:hypothetical protein